MSGSVPKSLPDSYTLTTSLDVYAITSNESDDTIIIDRSSAECRLAKGVDEITGPSQRRYIFGVAGVINLLDGPHLLVIQEREKVSSKPIFKITKWLMLPYSRSDALLKSELKSANEDLKHMIMQVLNTPSFYYSNSVDITHTQQRLNESQDSFSARSLFDRADERFVWNRNISMNWPVNEYADRFYIPIMHGFIHNQVIRLSNGRSFDWTIISRRSVERAGTRFNTRGADEEGHVANFVETEMIVETDKAKSSFVQTRGSIPVYWEQIPDLRYKPPILLSSEFRERYAKAHFDEQIMTYGRQVMINLIDQKGGEKALFDDISSCMDALPQVRYEPFDFHKECKGMRYDRLQILVDRLAGAQDSFGFFLEEGETAKSRQEGVFRTNCIDCLDRTNVVQSLMAKRSLLIQLVAHGVLRDTSDLDGELEFQNTYRNVWASNGDACSQQYTGTNALKSDFTRTGKRTSVGAMYDGWKSMVRYYKNNFADGHRQDGIDLLLGKCEPTVDPRRDLKLQDDALLAPLILMILIALLIVMIILKGVRDQSFFLIFVVWLVFMAFTLRNVWSNRSQYVDRPRLRRYGSFRD